METRAARAPLSTRASALAVVAVAVCVAVLWPKIISPQPDLTPNQVDRAQGCCDIFVDTDVDAINVISEICGIILQKQGNFDKVGKPGLKLTKDIVSLCRREVNTTCGIDIATFLDQNVRLGKTYKQILDEVRSYNGSNCLRDNYGVTPWSLGVPKMVGKFWVQDFGLRQERPPHLRTAPVHPALKERGRAITPQVRGGANVPTGAYQASAPLVQRGPMEGRVWPPPINAYFLRDTDEPLPIGGMRPPMGGAGGVIPPPKSSVGFLMPIYTLCIVIFFLYTVFKMVFRKSVSIEPTPSYDEVKPDPEFRRKVFENKRSNRASPESNKLGHKERDTRDEELDLLRARLAETERAMERIVRQMRGPLIGQESPAYTHTNGSLHHNKNGCPPIEKLSKEFIPDKQMTPPSWEDSTPVQEKDTLSKDTTSQSNEALHVGNDDKPPADIEQIRQIRSSVEKEKATVKVLGMEMTAHCEGGQKWMAQRPATPPVALPQRHPTSPVEVSSIYLEGALPHQSRLLVSDSETVTEELMNGDDKDAPIVLSGKMTLSVINDESSKTTPVRELISSDDTLNDFEDDDFTTASAATVPKNDDDEQLGDSEEEIEEEEIEEIEEIEEEECEEDIDERDEVISQKNKK